MTCCDHWNHSLAPGGIGARPGSATAYRKVLPLGKAGMRMAVVLFHGQSRKGYYINRFKYTHFLCIFLSIFIYIYIRRHTYTHSYIHYIHTYIRTYVRTYVRMYVRRYIHSLHCIALHCIALHCIALGYITFHSITLHSITYICSCTLVYVNVCAYIMSLIRRSAIVPRQF